MRIRGPTQFKPVLFKGHLYCLPILQCQKRLNNLIKVTEPVLGFEPRQSGPESVLPTIRLFHLSQGSTCKDGL